MTATGEIQLLANCRFASVLPLLLTTALFLPCGLLASDASTTDVTIVMLDVSARMEMLDDGVPRIDRARKIILELLAKSRPPSVRTPMIILAFNARTEVTEIHSLKELETYLASLKVSGATNLVRAMAEAATCLDRYKEANRLALVLLTDVFDRDVSGIKTQQRALHEHLKSRFGEGRASEIFVRTWGRDAEEEKLLAQLFGGRIAGGVIPLVDISMPPERKTSNLLITATAMHAEWLQHGKSLKLQFRVDIAGDIKPEIPLRIATENASHEFFTRMDAHNEFNVEVAVAPGGLAAGAAELRLKCHLIQPRLVGATLYEFQEIKPIVCKFTLPKATTEVAWSAKVESGKWRLLNRDLAEYQIRLDWHSSRPLIEDGHIRIDGSELRVTAGQEITLPAGAQTGNHNVVVRTSIAANSHCDVSLKPHSTSNMLEQIVNSDISLQLAAPPQLTFDVDVPQPIARCSFNRDRYEWKLTPNIRLPELADSDRRDLKFRVKLNNEMLRAVPAEFGLGEVVTISGDFPNGSMTKESELAAAVQVVALDTTSIATPAFQIKATRGVKAEPYFVGAVGVVIVIILIALGHCIFAPLEAEKEVSAP